MTLKSLLILAAVALAGCLHESPLKTEKAEVIQLAYVPSTSGTGVGFTGGGNMAVTSVTTDEVWAIVLKCKEHGAVFSFRDKGVYNQCKVGQIVTLEYVDYSNDKEQIVKFKTKKVIP